MAWLHAERFPWSGLRCGIPFATGSQGFPETPLDVSMQGLFYETSTAVFRSSCFFNSLLRCESTDHYTENIWRSMTFSFENLFVALWGLHRAQIGQHNGMIFGMSGICAWITGPTPVQFLPGHRNAWLNTGISLPTLQIYLPNAG